MNNFIKLIYLKKKNKTILIYGFSGPTDLAETARKTKQLNKYKDIYVSTVIINEENTDEFIQNLENKNKIETEDSFIEESFVRRPEVISDNVGDMDRFNGPVLGVHTL